MARRWKQAVLAVIGLVVVMQFVRPSTANPPVEPQREMAAHVSVEPGVQSIFNRACADCHSNQTVWPWYSHVAPASWLVASDVHEGRQQMNFSEWGAYPAEKSAELLSEICKEVQESEMPPMQYRAVHPSAGLTAAEREEVCRWTGSARPATADTAEFNSRDAD
jgi:hypothetical protein